MANFLSLNNVLSRLSGKKVIFPFYHVVSDQPLPYIENLYPVRSTLEFKKDLETILKDFQPIDINQSLKFSSKKLSFHLSFDDGLIQCYNVIAPILIEKGIPATFFLNTGFIDNKAYFYRFYASYLIHLYKKNRLSVNFQKQILKDIDKSNMTFEESILSLNHNHLHLLQKYVLECAPEFENQNIYMSSTQITDLFQKGFSLGAHSINHPHFSQISYNEMQMQITESVSYIRNHFDADNQLFSFPFTNHFLPKEFFDNIRKIPKFENLVYFGTSGIKDDINGIIQRIPIEKGKVTAATIIKNQYRNYLIKKIMGKSKVKRI